MLTSVGTTIGFVFTHIVPQLNPSPNEDSNSVVSLVLSWFAILITINDGIEAPPKFPNSPKL